MARKILIMGAAGRDFHNFNVRFRNDPDCRVMAFTAAQIPDIADRSYPAELAGPAYPEGIPIFPEEELPRLIRQCQVDQVIFSYSDIGYPELMHKAALVQAAGADFCLLGASSTMLPTAKPVVSVCAVRTGCGKSPTTRAVCQILQQWGKRVVVVRHPMPYGELARQAVQRFSCEDDFDRHACSIEEREEYQPLIDMGMTVYAGVDYAAILQQAEAEADFIVWDGGNNDTPFFRPWLQMVLLDPHRAGHECSYYPGETNLRLADIAVIQKMNSAALEQVERLRQNIAAVCPEAQILEAELVLSVAEGERLRGQRVLVVEDGPTLTHGGMDFGAGVLAARQYGAKIVDPRPAAVGEIAETFFRYPHVEQALPAIGYSAEQIRDLEASIAHCDCDLVLYATPAKLPQLLRIDKPTLQVKYRYRDHGRPTLRQLLEQRLKEAGLL